MNIDDTALSRCGQPTFPIYNDKDKVTMQFTYSGRLVAIKRANRRFGARIKDPQRFAQALRDAERIENHDRPPFLIWLGTAALIAVWAGIIAMAVSLWS